MTAVRPVNIRAERFYGNAIRFVTDTPVVSLLEVDASVQISEIKDATEGYTDQGTCWSGSSDDHPGTDDGPCTAA